MKVRLKSKIIKHNSATSLKYIQDKLSIHNVIALESDSRNIIKDIKFSFSDCKPHYSPSICFICKKSSKSDSPEARPNVN